MALALQVLYVPLSTADPAHVEVVVFAYERNIADDDEWLPSTFRKIEVEKDAFDLVDEPFEQDESTGTGHAASEEPAGFEDESLLVPVPPTQLNDFALALDEDPDIRILTHLSWIQEPEPKAISDLVELDVPFDDSRIFSDLELSGTAFLFEVAQTLQFEIDAVYKTRPDTELNAVQVPETIRLLDSSPEYRIFERRRVYINETHYFDHPKFGAVMTVVRPPKPQESVL